jgi:hypothetical protein
MSAEDNLSAILFHGTGVTFKPGDVVKPKGRGSRHAWAASSKDVAANFAGGHEGDTQSLVYRVTPVDPSEQTQTDDPNIHRSRKGFKVIGEA